MPKIAARYLVKETRSDRNGADVNETPVEISHGETIANNLITLISKKEITPAEVAKFKKELSKPFNYPRIAQEFSEGGDIQTDLIESEYAIHPTRPRIEALFFDHPAELAKVIDALVEANNAELNAEFMAALQPTELTEDMLFSWDLKKHQKLKDTLSELDDYGQYLNQQSIPKGKVMLDLHQKLQTEQNDFAENQKKSEVSPTLDNKHSPAEKTKKDLKVLQFKLKFANTLHEQDHVLSVHRGWKKIAFNFATIFLGFLPLLGNRIINGHWLFYNNTTSEEKTKDVQNALGFTKEMHFEVKAKSAPSK